MSLPNPEVLYARLKEQIKHAYPNRNEIGLIGIHRGGAWIAERLHADLKFALPCGFLDSALYRDDFSERGIKDDLIPPEVPFNVHNRQILIVDDVLYTGRTTRAIVNHLFDYGRPASIELAVLLDRGGRQLPIDAQFIGKHHQLAENQSFVLSRDDQGVFKLELKEQSE